MKKWADDEAFQREVMRVKQDNKMRHVFKLIFFLSCIIIPAFTPIVWSSCIGRQVNVGKLEGSTIWVVKDPEPRTMT